MKKILILMLAAALVLTVFTACNSSKDKEPASKKTDTENSEPSTQTVKSATSNLTIEVPEDWAKNPTESPTTPSISFLSKDGSEAVLIIEESAADFEAGLTLDKYSDMLVQVMQATDGSTNWQVGDLTDATVGQDVPAKQRELSVTISGVNLTYLQTVFQMGDSFVEVLEWTTPSNFADSKANFLEILTSVKF
jgi:hypothetical protein